MDKAIIDNLTQEQRVKMAVAYLLRHKDERPEGLEGFFKKLEVCEESARATNMAIGKSREALSHLETKFYHLMGSIDTLSELISEQLSLEAENNVQAWCEKYQPPAVLPNMEPGVDMTGNANISANVDIAGTTAHNK